MITNSVKSAPRKRSPKRLVHRLAQWELVQSEAQKRRQRVVFERSIINVFGAPGQGKTTLIHYTLRPRLRKLFTPPLPVALVDFDRDLIDAQYDLPTGRGRLVLTLIDELSRSIKRPRPRELRTLRRNWKTALEAHQGNEGEPEKDALYKAEEALVGFFNLNFIPDLLAEEETRPVVIFLDTAEEIGRDFMRWIQASLQGPSTDTGRVIWIVASRQPIDCQLYYIQSRFTWHELKLFDEKQVRKQIASRDRQLVETVIHYSQGLPAATERVSYIIDALKRKRDTKPTSEDLRRHEKELIGELSRLIDGYLKDLEPKIQESVRVLSPIRFLNLAIITKALPRFLPDQYGKEMIGTEPLDIQDHLISQRLVYWDRSRRGYVIEEPIRQIIARVLRYSPEHRGLYMEIHRWAQEQFERLAEQDRDKRLDYIIEGLYHRAVILVELENASNAVEELRAVLHEQTTAPGNGIHAPEALDQLRRQIETDHDFQRLLGEDLSRLTVGLRGVEGTEEKRPGRI